MWKSGSIICISLSNMDILRAMCAPRSVCHMTSKKQARDAKLPGRILNRKGQCKRPQPPTALSTQCKKIKLVKGMQCRSTFSQQPQSCRGQYAKKAVVPVVLENIAEMGSCFQSSDDHLIGHRRNNCYPSNCMRCHFLRPGADFWWVEERPQYLGGDWALGCRVCAWTRLGDLRSAGVGTELAVASTGNKKKKHRIQTIIKKNPATNGHKEKSSHWRSLRYDPKAARFGVFASFSVRRLFPDH